MPPTPRSAKAALNVDERKLLELVKSKNDLSTRGQKKVWEKIAEELNAPVESVKKAWSKLQEEGAEKKIKESNMRRSLRTSSLDTSKDLQKKVDLCRRSLRSTSIDKSSISGLSNENSCASSTCSSPKTEDKRSLRSRSQLSSITEAELRSSITEAELRSSITEAELMSMAAGDATIIALEELKDQTQDSDQEQTLVFEISNLQSPFPQQFATDSTDRYQQDSGVERSLRSRFSEPAHPTSKQMIQTPLNNSPRRAPNNNNNKNNRNKRSPNPNDSTRTFFDSMALTVASFPQHLQAQVKIKVCKIISETEYDLSLPKAY